MISHLGGGAGCLVRGAMLVQGLGLLSMASPRDGSRWLDASGVCDSAVLGAPSCNSREAPACPLTLSARPFRPMPAPGAQASKRCRARLDHRTRSHPLDEPHQP